jgi:hypothetical protein
MVLTRRVVGLFAIVLLVLLSATPTAAQSPYQRCFAETGFCISRRIYEYWQQNGGLPVFGYPITGLQIETIEGQPIEVQWFERARLELHPDNAAPYDVLLGRLGGDALVGQPAATREEPRADCRYFSETGFNVCSDFLAYWRANGLELDGRSGKTEAESLALFGLPLTGEVQATLADGKTYTVQWFERARFERHPENAPPYNVLLGQLGRDLKQPTLPGEDATIVAIVRAGGSFSDLDTVIEYVCTEDDLASAVVFPMPEGSGEPIVAVMKRSADGWGEVILVPGFSLSFREFREGLGLPMESDCIGEPID